MKPFKHSFRIGTFSLVRWFLILALWILLTSGRPADVLPGVVVATLCAILSSRLLPAAFPRWNLWGGIVWTGRFVFRALIAGWDVALLAMDPRRRLHPGFLSVQQNVSQGLQEELFAAICTLQPGTLLCNRDRKDGWLLHALEKPKMDPADLMDEQDRIAEIFSISKSDTLKNGKQNE